MQCIARLSEKTRERGTQAERKQKDSYGGKEGSHKEKEREREMQPERMIKFWRNEDSWKQKLNLQKMFENV